DGARLGDALQPRRDVDAVAVDILAFNDDVAKVDANPEFDAAAFGRGTVALNHARLDGDCTAHGLDRASEGHQQPIAGPLNDAATVSSDQGSDAPAGMRNEPTKRALLVVAHEPAIAGDVKRHDRCNFAFGVLILHLVRPSFASQAADT